ncbi:MAG: sigma 54-interacting transcriptional regulator [Aerococcus sp.]|nr:sigma 54-interacting transcriptional regulator [Aerococcus sp.]
MKEEAKQTKEELKQTLLTYLCQGQELTTDELADRIKRSRSVTSLYLNELLRSGEVEKQKTRPVRWQLKQQNEGDSDDPFQHFIGADGSLKVAVEQVKSAIHYPPMGMPILLHGHSGVGKTYFARVIADHLDYRQATNAKRMLVFNCADYANNPELLSSILFGYVKGAFTGADQDSTGLLKQADGGILFLDEVHRLTFENQEKLFQFMDHGYFHRLGDEETPIYAKVRLLFATTEAPDQVLLSTFYRRIPLTVELADFEQRPYAERLLLIGRLLFLEAEQIARPVLIDAQTLHQLAEQRYLGNIGGLKNRIKLLCANSLQRDRVGEVLKVSENPDHDSYYLTVEELQSPLRVEKMQLAERSGVLREWLKQLPNPKAQQLLNEQVQKWQEQPLNVQEELTYQQLKELLQERWQLKTGRMWQQPLALTALTWASQISDSELDRLANAQLKQLRYDYPRAVACAHQLLGGSAFAKPLLLALLTTFLRDEVSEAVRYQGLLVAHGTSTATSIQTVVNQMLGDYVFDAIDMPLESSVSDIVLETQSWLAQRDTGAGVIMMVDMGSLTQLYKQLKPQIRGQLLVINNLTTAYALELGQLILNHPPFLEMVDQMKELPSLDVQYFEGFAVSPNVIISSFSGGEITESLAGIFAKYLYADIKVMPLEYKKLMDAVDQALQNEAYLSSTQLIITVGSANLPPRFKTLDIMTLIADSSAIMNMAALNGLMNPASYPHLLGDLLHLFSKEGLKEKLTFLNPEIIITQVEQAIEKMEGRFQYALDPALKFMLMMHLAVMVERMILSGETYEVPINPETLTFNGKPFYLTLKSVLLPLEQFYRLSVNDWEIYMIYEMLQGMRQ